MRTQFQRLIPAIVLLPLLLPMRVDAAERDEEEYILPLVPPYAVIREHRMIAQSNGQGVYRLVELPSSPGVQYSFTDVVAGVEKLAVVGKIITGKAKDGFFLIDAGHAKPLLALSTERWKQALAEAGLTQSVQLASPDSMAVGQPESVLRPWKFRMMKGTLGMSDDLWSLVIQIVGVFFAFRVGLLGGRKRSPLVDAVLLGLAVNVVAQIVVAGGGPGAFAGFIVFPVLFVVVAYIGRMVGRLIPSNKEERSVASS